MTHTTTDDGSERDRTTGVAPHEWHRALGDERRLATVRALDRGDPPVDLDPLAADVAARTEVDAERVRTALHHVHLPLLADAGVLTYDAAEHRVTDCETPPAQLF